MNAVNGVVRRGEQPTVVRRSEPCGAEPPLVGQSLGAIPVSERTPEPHPEVTGRGQRAAVQREREVIDLFLAPQF